MNRSLTLAVPVRYRCWCALLLLLMSTIGAVECLLVVQVSVSFLYTLALSLILTY